METVFMNTENSKTSESYRFQLDLTDKLNLKDLTNFHKFYRIDYTLLKLSILKVCVI